MEGRIITPQSTVNSQQSRLRLCSALTLSEVVPLRGSKLRVAVTIGEGSTVNNQQSTLPLQSINIIEPPELVLNFWLYRMFPNCRDRQQNASAKVHNSRLEHYFWEKTFQSQNALHLFVATDKLWYFQI